MKKLLIILTLGILVSIQGFSQTKVTLSYSIAVPLGDLGDFIQPASFRGIALDYHSMVYHNFGIGVSTAWNVFYEEKEKDTYTFENKAITGKQYRYSNHIPLLFSAAYYLSPDETLNPFVSLGIGTVYTRRNTDMGQYTIEQVAWNFALAPEVGFLYKVGYSHAISISAQYYNGFKSGNELDTAQSYFAFKLGFEL